MRSGGYTFVNFFGCVCAGGSISGECCDVSSAFLSAVCFGRTDMDRKNAGVFTFGIVSGFACKRMVLHDALGASFERRV